MIQIDGLSFRYPRGNNDAISNLSLRVRHGSLFGLLGPNGSGKTTLISILIGLLPSPPGRVQIEGISLQERRPETRSFSALVPQDYAFYPRLSIAENLAFFAGVLAIPAAETGVRIQEALSVSGLEPHHDTRAERLSGGLKRRLNLAIGLLNRPRLLFLDEPTVGIDPQSRHFILKTIRRINSQGTTVVYTSHNMEEVESLCDEIGVLDNGRLLVQGTLEQLLGGSESKQLVVGLASALTAEQCKALAARPGLEVAGAELRVAHCSAADFQHLMALLATHGLKPSRVKYGYGNLEQLFLHLTGHRLRD